MTETATSSPDPVFGKWVLAFWKPSPTWSRVALTLAWAISLIVFYKGSSLFSVPPLSQFDGSLFCNPSAFTGVIVMAILLLVCTLLGTVIAGAVRFEAGFFAAALGMLAVSLRSGTMRAVIFESGGVASVCYKLAAETFVLTLILAAAWVMLILLGQLSRGQSVSFSINVDEAGEPSTLQHCLGALTTQIIATGVFVELLAVTEIKNQVLGAIFFASILGAIAAHLSFPSRQPWCYWAGPLILGIIGYIIAGSGAVAGFANGNLTGTFAPLARPLPLDYASVGPAGALIGYWIARGWGAESDGVTE